MRTEEFQRVFNLPFNEAEVFFLDKLNVPSDTWNDLSGKAHAKAFTSAGAHNAELLADLRAMTDKAIGGNMDIREFRKQFKTLVSRYGWQLKGGGPSWRSDLIWRTNISTAYQAGRWQQFEEGGIDYLMYKHNDSVQHPRPNHVALDGKIIPRDDPFWIYNYPPNGWGCKCRAVAASKKEYQAASKERTTPPENYQNMADGGWNYNVGIAGEEKGYRALTEKMESLPNDIAMVWMRRFVTEPAFERFIAGEIKGEFPVAVLDTASMEAIGAESQVVWLQDASLQRDMGSLSLAEFSSVQDLVAFGWRQNRTFTLDIDGSSYRATLRKITSGKKSKVFLESLTVEPGQDE